MSWRSGPIARLLKNPSRWQKSFAPPFSKRYQRKHGPEASPLSGAHRHAGGGQAPERGAVAWYDPNGVYTWGIEQRVETALAVGGKPAPAPQPTGWRAPS